MLHVRRCRFAVCTSGLWASNVQKNVLAASPINISEIMHLWKGSQRMPTFWTDIRQTSWACKWWVFVILTAVRWKMLAMERGEQTRVEHDDLLKSPSVLLNGDNVTSSAPRVGETYSTTNRVSVSSEWIHTMPDKALLIANMQPTLFNGLVTSLSMAEIDCFSLN